MEFHPIANIFPLMEGEVFDQLCEDIRENGLREPVVLYEEKILDGRNRYRACEKVGGQLWMGEYAGDDPLGYVVSLNLHRRHLNESQRAMVAAKIANMRRGDNPSIEGLVSQPDAAKMLNVGVATVERAAKVQREASPAIIAAVEKGDVKVSTAAASLDAAKKYPALNNPHWSPAAVVKAEKALDRMGEEEKRAVLGLFGEVGGDVERAVAIAEKVSSAPKSEVKAFVAKIQSEDEKDREDAARWATSQSRLCDPLIRPCLKIVHDAEAALKQYPGRPEEVLIQRGIAQFERAVESLKRRHQEESNGAIDD